MGQCRPIWAEPLAPCFVKGKNNFYSKQFYEEDAKTEFKGEF